MDADASPGAPGLSASSPGPQASVSDPGAGAALADAQPTSASSDGEARPSGGKQRNPWRWVGEWAAVLVVALAVALLVRAFVVQTFFIPSPSMEPTLMVGDRILVDKLSYHLHSVHRGDIVVFGRPPGESATENVQDLVKRVVGLPHETIWSANGNVYVQGADTKNKVTEIAEPVAGTPLGPPIRRQTLGADDYFVMGDNRSNSDDSRFFGPISGKLIVGRVVMRIWPITHISFF